MNDPADNERLLTDVLADEAGFREALFSETLRLARRRRRFRQARRATAAVAVLVGLAALVWQSLPPRGVVPQTAGKPYVVVRTQPLPPAALVTTRPLSADNLVASVTTASIITTLASSGQFREIGDDELLALVAPKAAVLIRLGPHMAELVVLEPAEPGTAAPN